MTREEAIQVLNMVEAHGSLVIQAKEKAIKALEQEPRVTMRDLSEEELKHFAEEMKKVRPQALEQKPKTGHWIETADEDGKNEILNKIKAEIMDTLYVDSLIFGELIDFKNGKIDADDVIEEFNRLTRMEVLRIIDKYKLESEDKE